MKWLFLAFIALLAITGNAAVFESLSLGRAVGGIVFNLLVLALVAIWWASYFSGAQTKARLLVVGHASLMLAAGIGMTLIGAQVALSNSCESLIFGSKPHGLLSQFATYIELRGYCRELGFCVVLFGLFMAYPSIRLFAGITRRSSRLPSAAADL